MGLSDTFPHPLVASERDAEGRIVLLRPKFLSPWMQWLQRRLPRPHFRVHLDPVGTALWEACDGTRSLEELYGILRARFGETVEPVEERAGRLVQELANGRFLRLEVRRPGE